MVKIGEKDFSVKKMFFSLISQSLKVKTRACLVHYEVWAAYSMRHGHSGVTTPFLHPLSFWDLQMI